ncbi:hypothetical protein KIN20_009456 [Parelaphostrongylus tenuis]|uniref:Uncharacterized protein n=1 Tax=Parelaphostrongylus tenuis TaxID=148309 RepID=A0AAD5MQJ2_PARTN|nr:hypothetical protein KIN20_009456 [Parelaphostrongylus tenuis]
MTTNRMNEVLCYLQYMCIDGVKSEQLRLMMHEWLAVGFKCNGGKWTTDIKMHQYHHHQRINEVDRLYTSQRGGRRAFK